MNGTIDTQNDVHCMSRRGSPLPTTDTRMSGSGSGVSLSSSSATRRRHPAAARGRLRGRGRPRTILPVTRWFASLLRRREPSLLTRSSLETPRPMKERISCPNPEACQESWTLNYVALRYQKRWYVWGWWRPSPAWLVMFKRECFRDLFGVEGDNNSGLGRETSMVVETHGR